jgi:hypothetical protein
MFAWDGWAGLSAEIQDQEKALLAIVERFDAFKVQEEWERQQDWNKRMLAEDGALGEEVRSRIAAMLRDERRALLLQWLTSVNIDTKYNNEREKHQEGTRAWLVNGTQFQQWMKTAHSILWLHGKGA